MASGVNGALLYLNSSGLTYSQPTALKVGFTPTGIAFADFTLDGKPDLVLVSGTAATGTVLSQVAVAPNAGSGMFSSLKNSPLAKVSLSAVVAGDFNKDGKPDVVVANSLAANLYPLLGVGDGTFIAGQPVGLPGGAAINAMVADDFDGDGKLDVAVASPDGNVYVFLNTSP